MNSQNERGRPRQEGGALADQRHGDGADPNKRTTGRARVEVEVAHLRIQLCRMAAGGGRPLRTAADERAHADRRRSGELARMGRVGA
ncbi:hypothetical protein [Parafrankia sp. FMc2]|uniref:hypothetical protein n=1 Tax=Parafrankia sp. FMc2 TaxID=3233196 RepID=UPI0034D6F639